MAAKAPWQSEICPAIPVITVIERKIVERITAWVMRNSHSASARVNTTIAHDHEEHDARRSAWRG